MDCHTQQKIHKPFSVAYPKARADRALWPLEITAGTPNKMTGTCFREDAPREAALYP